MVGRIILLAAATLFCIGALLIGCREDAPPAGPSASVAPLRFVPGDRILYANWKLDLFGYPILSSRFSSTWTVIDTGVAGPTHAPRTVIVDSIFARTATGPDTLSRVDTVLFHFSPSGDVYRYGFLADLIRRRESRIIPPRWDRIIAPSGRIGEWWIVGYADGAGTDAVTGRIPGARELAAVVINGVPHILQAYRIEIFHRTFDSLVRVSDVPSMFLGFREEPRDTLEGLLQEATEVVRAGL